MEAAATTSGSASAPVSTSASSARRMRGSQNCRMCPAIAAAASSVGRCAELRRDVAGEPDRGRGAHSPATGTAARAACASCRAVTSSTCTAVTLYSGQLVAQSECSVVTTFAPVTGWWNVV